MKRLTLIIAIVCAVLTSCRAQNPFQAVADMKGVETVYVGKAMMKLAGSMNLGVPGLSETAGNLESVLVMEIDNSKAAEKAHTMVSEYVKANKLEPLMASGDGEESMIIYGLTDESGENINKLLLLDRDGSEVNLIMIQGQITMEQISKMVNE